MISTVAIVLVVLAVIVGGGLIYVKHRATINKEAKRVADQAREIAEKEKLRRQKRKKVGK